MNTLATCFRAILAAISPRAAALLLFWNHIAHSLDQLDHLLTLWRTNTLPPPCEPNAPRPTAPPIARPTATPTLNSAPRPRQLSAPVCPAAPSTLPPACSPSAPPTSNPPTNGRGNPKRQPPAPAPSHPGHPGYAPRLVLAPHIPGSRRPRKNPPDPQRPAVPILFRFSNYKPTPVKNTPA